MYEKDMKEIRRNYNYVASVSTDIFDDTKLLVFVSVPNKYSVEKTLRKLGYYCVDWYKKLNEVSDEELLHLVEFLYINYLSNLYNYNTI